MPELDQIILKLLDWPFLIALLVAAIMVKFGDQFRQLLTRGDIQISWGEGKSIQLRELSENLDKDLQPIQDDVEALKQEVAKLRGNLAEGAALATAPDQPTFGKDNEGATPEFGSADVVFDTGNEQEASPEQRIRDALTDSRFRWRTLERLASVSGQREEKALSILQRVPEILVSTDRSGRIIARLKDK